MAKKQHHEEHEEHADESWLIPYADLLTLLLALFIVLFASSQVDTAKFAAIANAFTNEIMGGAAFSGIGDHTAVTTNIPPEEMPSPGDFDPSESSGGADSQTAEEALEAAQAAAAAAAAEEAMMTELQAQLNAYLKENGLEATVQTYIDKRGLVISMNNAVLFKSAQADILPAYQETLAAIGNTINKLPNYIRVEGHTDSTPISTAKYESNWELSAARASRVVRLFASESQINPEKLIPVGYADNKPVGDNNTAEGRAKNRRIDIIVLGSRYNELEAQLGDTPPATPTSVQELEDDVAAIMPTPAA